MKPDELIRTAIDTHKRLLKDLESAALPVITAASQLLIESIRAGGCIYICGNGGSAADAQHIATELVGRSARERKGLPAVALTTDPSILTAVGNDYGFEQIFARQVEALVNQGDILWAFSTSGTSNNVLAAARLAKEKKAAVLAFTGRPGSPLEQLADVCLALDGATASVQEIHQLAYHIVCDLVEAAFAKV